MKLLAHLATVALSGYALARTMWRLSRTRGEDVPAPSDGEGMRSTLHLRGTLLTCADVPPIAWIRVHNPAAGDDEWMRCAVPWEIHSDVVGARGRVVDFVAAVRRDDAGELTSAELREIYLVEDVDPMHAWREWYGPADAAAEPEPESIELFDNPQHMLEFRERTEATVRAGVAFIHGGIGDALAGSYEAAGVSPKQARYYGMTHRVWMRVE